MILRTALRRIHFRRGMYQLIDVGFSPRIRVHHLIEPLLDDNIFRGASIPPFTGSAQTVAKTFYVKL